MLKSKRRSLQFDSLEGKVLLSAGMADPAATVHLAAARRISLTGTVFGLPFGSIQHNGIQVSSFAVVGKTRSMGRVNGSFDLANSFIPTGRLPDLSNATLTLSNQHGSVQLKMAASPGRRYIFLITSGSGNYVSANGSGTLSIAYNPKRLDFVVNLRTNPYG